jgi:hypothetical protein
VIEKNNSEMSEEMFDKATCIFCKNIVFRKQGENRIK